MSRLDAIEDWEERARRAGYCVRTLAAQVEVCPRHLRRHLAGTFHQPSKCWMDNLRAEEACRMLLAGDSLKSVTFELGFKQVSHFCAFFKRARGITPLAWVLAASRAKMSAFDNRCPL